MLKSIINTFKPMAKKTTSKSSSKTKTVDTEEKYWASFGKSKKVKTAFFAFHENVDAEVTSGSDCVNKYLNIIRKTSNGKGYISHQAFVKDGGKMDGSNITVI